MSPPGQTPAAVPVYDETTGEGQLRHVVARTTAGTASGWSSSSQKASSRKKNDLLSFLEDFDSVWHNENAKDTNVIFGDQFTLLVRQAGADRNDRRKALLRQPAVVFAGQPRADAGALRNRAGISRGQAGETVVDAYCGVGTISLFIAGDCKRVIGVEQIAPAIEDAKANAQANGVTNAEFVCGNVEDVLPRLILRRNEDGRNRARPAAQGLRRSSARGNRQEQRKAAWSTFPATPPPSRGTASIWHEHGFALSAVRPVDMFPQRRATSRRWC